MRSTKTSIIMIVGEIGRNRDAEASFFVFIEIEN